MSNGANGLARWAQVAPIGSVTLYDPRNASERRHAYWLYKTSQFMLYQRRVNGNLVHMVQRISPNTFRFINWVSRMTKAPYNPLAHEIDADDTGAPLAFNEPE